MGRTSSASTNSTSRGLAAISALSDADKALLFYHLKNAQANFVASRPPVSTWASHRDANPNNHVVYFANAYSAMAQAPVKSDEMVSVTGADRFIFHKLAQFANLQPVTPVSMKTADGYGMPQRPW